MHHWRVPLGILKWQWDSNYGDDPTRRSKKFGDRCTSHVYTVFHKKNPCTFSAHNLRQMLTDFHNSFTNGLNSKRIMKWSLKIWNLLQKTWAFQRNSSICVWVFLIYKYKGQTSTRSAISPIKAPFTLRDDKCKVLITSSLTFQCGMRQWLNDRMWTK